MKLFRSMYKWITENQLYWIIIFCIVLNVVITNYFHFFSNEIVHLGLNGYVSYMMLTTIALALTLIVRFNKWDKTNTSWGSFRYPALSDLEKIVIVLMFVVSIFFVMKPNTDYFISQLLLWIIISNRILKRHLVGKNIYGVLLFISIANTSLLIFDLLVK